MCLGKAVLDCLADGRGRGIDIYSRYINETTLIDTDLSFTGLSRFGLVNRQMMAKLQYREDSPTIEPAHWSVFSGHDIAKVASLLSVDLVMFLCDANVPFAVSNSYWTSQMSSKLWLWHDTRTHLPVDSRKEIVLFVATVAGNTPRRLFKLPSRQLDRLTLQSHIWFGREVGSARHVCLSVDDFNGNYLSLIDTLLDIAPPPPTTTTTTEIAGHFASLSDFYGCDRHALHKRWAAAASCVVILSYLHKAGKSVNARHWINPKALRFTCLAITSDRATDVCVDDFVDHATPDATVVCFVGGKYACLLAEPYRIQALTYHTDTRGLAQRLMNRTDLSSVPRVLPAETVAAAAAEKRRKNKSKNCDSSKWKRLKKICRCSCCRRDAKKYASNMASFGPERLCTVPYSLTDLLQMLGAYDARSRQLVRRMVHLSVAAMDIESQTIEVDLAGPKPGPRLRYPQFGGPTVEGHIVKTQRPIMIGHSDVLLREGSRHDGNGWWYDTVTDDSPEAVYAMLARYWLRVCHLHREARDEKKKISTELFDLVAKYRSAFDAYSKLWVEMSEMDRSSRLTRELADLHHQLVENVIDEDQYKVLADFAERAYLRSDEWAMPEYAAMLAAFRCTVPGKLEARLLTLLHRYVVFTFYG